VDENVKEAAALGADASPATIARSIVESVASAAAAVVEELGRAQPVETLALVGGGAASPLVRDRLAAHANACVVAGSTEATALGNALVQGSRSAGSTASALGAAGSGPPRQDRVTRTCMLTSGCVGRPGRRGEPTRAWQLQRFGDISIR
jgi:sugar (pentulose or hexulose) kinase